MTLTSNVVLRLPFLGPYYIILVYMLPICICVVVKNKKRKEMK